MATIFPGTTQVRRKSSTTWTAQNYVLLAGEIGYETNTRKIKVGDGVTGWNSLGYVGGTTGGASAFTDLTDAASADIVTTNLSVSSGLAGKVPTTRALAGLSLAADHTAAELKTALSLAKADVGLSNADNTSDLAKPVSTATQTQLDLKPTTYAGLTDKVSVDLPNVNTALSTALGLKTPYEATVASGIVIPLDTPANGKFMPQVTLTADSVISIGPGPVEKGNCSFSFVGDGSHTPDFTAFTITNGYTYSPTLNANNVYIAVYSYNTAFLAGYRGSAAVADLLAENGDFLMAETGDFLILE